jgi:16S rRNA (cytosine967-C5)-methyltransferase
MRPAREIALKVLEIFGAQPGDASGILRKHIDRTPDRGLATDLVFGVIRNRPCIDHIIECVGGVPVDRVSRQLINIIRMGIYELVYCPDREAYAIVSETMKQTEEMPARQKGFVNAILRKTCRLITERSMPLADAPPAMTVPVTLERGCRFSIKLFADPAKEPSAYLAEAFSLPAWLVEEWVNSFGVKDATQACFGSNRRPSVYIRPNTLKVQGAELFKRFQADEIECEMVTDKGIAIQTKGGRSVEKLPGYAEGFFSVQDITASEAVRMMAPQAGWRVLDMCAAPGGKTIQLAQAMGDIGQILATDIDAARLKVVSENIARMGIKSAEVVSYGEVAAIAAKVGGFDAALLDVPCSNTGTMARRCEVRYRLRSKSIASLAAVQSGLLATAADLVKAGGRICYSTCSIQNAENELVTAAFLKSRSDFQLVEEKLILPSAGPIDRDGGYVAILKKL